MHQSYIHCELTVPLDELRLYMRRIFEPVYRVVDKSNAQEAFIRFQPYFLAYSSRNCIISLNFHLESMCINGNGTLPGACLLYTSHGAGSQHRDIHYSKNLHTLHTGVHTGTETNTSVLDRKSVV